MFSGFYHGKKVLVTGHTGFKGAWLSLWLRKLGAKVHGISLEPPTQPNLYEIIQAGTFKSEARCDILDYGKLAPLVAQIQPDLVFHLAAQALVRQSYQEPLHTLHTNVQGTAHVLEAVRASGLGCTVIAITSDKCYENSEWEFAYRETDRLGGHDVYSMSKAAAELVVASWNKSFFLKDPRLGHLVSVRAGNVIGGGDYAADRIVPDCIRALQAKQSILVRNPAAVRPWQHVLECLSGYLCLGARLANEPKGSSLATPFNFGPEASSRQPVRLLVEQILKIWPGQWVDGSRPNSPHEATLLALSIEKAAAKLQWYPTWNFEQAVRHTIDWYAACHLEKRPDLQAFTSGQIDTFTQDAVHKGLAWTT
jgi:CDP-glucose 4,6-dehydratase